MPRGYMPGRNNYAYRKIYQNAARNKNKEGENTFASGLGFGVSLALLLAGPIGWIILWIILACNKD